MEIIYKNSLVRNVLILAVVGSVAYLMWYHLKNMKKAKELAAKVEGATVTPPSTATTTETTQA